MKLWIKEILTFLTEIALKIIALFGERGRFTSRTLKQFLKKSRIRNHIYARYYDRLPIDSDIVLYESYNGAAMKGNPYAIFKELLNDPTKQQFTHVWCLNETLEFRDIISQFDQHKNIIYVKQNSTKYLRYLASAKYLFNDVTFHPLYTPKDGQIYTNTWHGTPLKHLGYDAEPYKNITNSRKNFMATTYYINENRYTTDIILDSYNMRGVYNGTFIEEGYPRADLTLNTDKAYMIERLNKHGLNICTEQKVYLYAPTFRGHFMKPTNIMPQVIELHDKLVAELDDPKVKIILKVHPALYRHYVKNNPKYSAMCVPDIFDTNEVLSVVDVLIADYSSIFVDFMATKRPIVFYMPDVADYQEARGLYLEIEELPGPITTTDEELIVRLNSLEESIQSHQAKYEKLHTRWCRKNDGRSSRRVIDIIFNENNNYDLYQPEITLKKKLLIYPGGMQLNGITESFLSLLTHINYTAYDVSVYLSWPPAKDTQHINANIDRIPREARVIFRQDYVLATFKEFWHQCYTSVNVDKSLDIRRFEKSGYSREAKRVFGNQRFDYVIDFCGYSAFSTALLVEGFKSTSKTIFLHADIQGEMDVRFPWLQRVVNLYHRFDNITNVSSSVMDQNKQNLFKYAPDANWCTATNTLNLNRIIEGAKKVTSENTLILDEIAYQIRHQSITPNSRKLTLFKLPDPDYINFVHNARLSPEKRHDKLFEALVQIKEMMPNQPIKVYLVGVGPLDKQLKQLARRLGIWDMLVFVGPLSNPFLLLRQVDALLLSSDHEGQGLVLLEAMTLGIPTISTDIPQAVELAEDGKYGITTPNNAEGLAQGIMDFIQERPTFERFDAQKYNAMALEQFYNILK